MRSPLAILMLSLGLLNGGKCTDDEPRKNVLFLVVDDLRPELGVYADPVKMPHINPKIHTPNIDALARRSLLLKRSYVQYPLCAPSRASILTGRRPDTTNVFGFDKYWRNSGGNFTTIPQFFKENGYTTLGMGKIFHFGIPSNGNDPPSWSGPYFPDKEFQVTPAALKNKLNIKRSKRSTASQALNKEAKIRRSKISAASQALNKEANIGRSKRSAASQALNKEANIGRSKRSAASQALNKEANIGRSKRSAASQALKKEANIRRSKKNSWTAVSKKDAEKNPGLLFDEQIADHAVATLRMVGEEATSGGQPFFVAVGFHKPHLTFDFPAEMLETYPMEDIKAPQTPYAPLHFPEWARTRLVLGAYKDIIELGVTSNVNATVPLWKVLELRRAYYSAVTWIDGLVGRVLDELERLGLADNTIVSFWGDHGFELGEHGTWCKNDNYELALHAPLMVRIPGVTDHGVSTDQLVEHVDLFPTLVEATGFDPLEVCPENSGHVTLCSEGKSLLPLIESPELPIKHASFSQVKNKGHMGYSIRTDRYRYTEYVVVSRNKKVWSNVKGVQLYDHVLDVSENVNVAFSDDYADVRRELSERLRRGWRHEMNTN